MKNPVPPININSLGHPLVLEEIWNLEIQL
jgi:hypothetical protein